jgi:hypothetical protein
VLGNSSGEERDGMGYQRIIDLSGFTDGCLVSFQRPIGH